MLARRRVEAEIIKPIYEELCTRLGTDTAKQIIGNAIKKATIAEGKAFGEKVGSRPGLKGFVQIAEQWGQDNALESTCVEQDAHRLVEHVTRCRYAEMYREMPTVVFPLQSSVILEV